MSLLDEFMTPCRIVNKIKDSTDGAGGLDVQWVDGAQFDAAIVKDTSMRAKLAEKEGVTSVYTITTRSNVRLEFHDYVKRLSDGKIFRVTTDSLDSSPPPSSSLDMAQVQAEEWRLTK